MPTALIIGSSDGIGLALTGQLLTAGWRVVGLSRSPSPVKSPAHAHHVADVCAADYAAHLERVLVESPAVDVCVYCAAIGEFVDVATLEHDRRVFETNLLGAVATAQVVVPAMIRRGHGHFIGLSSQTDRYNDPAAPSYAASKAGLSSYLEGLALACRQRGVSISNVRLGFVDTKLAKARVRPFMVSADQAARVVRRCIERRPVRYTFPRRMAILMWFLRAMAGWQRHFGGSTIARATPSSER